MEKSDEDTLANPFLGLNENEVTFCIQLSLNKSQVESYMLAYGVNRVTASRIASRKANEPKIVVATNSLRVEMASQRHQSALLTKEELLGFLTRAIRTPLSDIDEYDPITTTKKTTINDNGVTHYIEKVDPLGAAKLAAKIQGWDMPKGPAIGDMPISELLGKIRSSGFPQERDITPKVLEIEPVAESHPAKPKVKKETT